MSPDPGHLHIAISRFRDARDVLPRPALLTWRELVDLVAPSTPSVRSDLVHAEARRLRVVDHALQLLLEHRPAPAWLADHPSWRALERAAWTAGPDPEARRNPLLAAANKARETAIRKTKMQLPCWSPVVCLPASTRGLSSVQHVTCLVLDYDDGTSIDEAVRPWTDWPLIVATTWSHRPATPRFRLVLVLDRPVPPEAWPRAWGWAAQRAAGAVDPACKDPSRLYLLPAVRSSSAPYVRLVHDPGGHLLDIDWERLPDPLTLEPAHSEEPVHGGRPPADPARARARQRFRVDAGARHRAAAWLNASLAGRRAERVPCPACSRPSVWFWLEPGPQSTASCHHRHSCGWWGHLDELLDASGDHHED